VNWGPSLDRHDAGVAVRRGEFASLRPDLRRRHVIHEDNPDGVVEEIESTLAEI
jgi:hypothetical protein